jgi:beta-glucosidase
MRTKLTNLFTLFLVLNSNISFCQTGIDKKIESLLSQLTLEEKINMVHASGIFISGGVPRLGIPELIMSDGPCGIRMEINRNNWMPSDWNNDNGSYFPSQTALAATWDTSLARSFGLALGEESKIRGKNIQLAPGINIIRTPLGGRDWEYMSEDPFLVSQLVVPLIEGMQSNGIAACVKHYALNNQETERGSIDVYLDERTLREIYLPGFEAAIKKAGSLTIMGAYNKFEGQHATYNKYLIQEILKGEWGFKGPVISDWNACHSTMEAAKDGLDIEMGTRAKSFNDYYMAQPLLDSIKSGKISENVLDDKIRRILYLDFRLKLFNKPAFDTTGMYNKLATPDKSAIVKKIAEESIVLLKNTNNFLPINFSNINSIAIIGDNATRKQSFGGGSTIVKARYEITPLEAFKEKLSNKVKVNYAQGYKSPERLGWKFDTTRNNIDYNLLNEAVETAKNSDIVIFFGGLNHNPGCDCEGYDKPDMKLPYGQDTLLNRILKVNHNVIVVINAGSPVELGEWYSNIPSLLQCSYLGMESGNALFSIISGETNPGGKLTMTFPKKLADSPSESIGEYPGKNGKEIYKDSLMVGYRYFDTKNVEPMFPFGYGLSYTTFEYKNLQIPNTIKLSDEKIPVKFEITNTGKYVGQEISELYIHEIIPKVERPYKELKGFSKVSINPGETKDLIIYINKRAFEYYSVEKKSWVYDVGKFEIMIGSSSKNIKLTKETIIN